MTDEHTPAGRGLGRLEYGIILGRLDKIQTLVAEANGHAARAANAALEAHKLAQTALWARSSWGPYVVSGLAFAMAFAACVSR